MSESEEQDDPKELKEKREKFRFELRDNTQVWWESSFIFFFETIASTAVAWGLYAYLNVPFELIVFVFLASISAYVGSIWRCYVR